MDESETFFIHCYYDKIHRVHLPLDEWHETNKDRLENVKYWEHIKPDVARCRSMKDVKLDYDNCYQFLKQSSIYRRDYFKEIIMKTLDNFDGHIIGTRCKKRKS